MPAQYILLSCVRLAVCPSHHPNTVSKHRNDWTNEAGFWHGPQAFFHFLLSTLYYKEIWLSPKIRVLPSGTLCQTLDLENSPQQVDNRAS